MKLLLLILLFGCKEELKYSKEQLLKMAQEADPTTTVVLPRNMNEGVSCSSYPAGCLSAHIVKIKNLDLIAIEFASEKDAVFAAKKIRGYYVRNWVFDDVTGEPILEKFVVKHLEAQKP